MISYFSENFDLYNKISGDVLEECLYTKLEKGHVIFERGQNSRGLFLISKGVVGLMGYGKSGDDTLLKVFGENSFLGYRSFLSSEEIHATALALSDIEIVQFPFDDSTEVLNNYPELFKYLSKVIAIDLKIAEERLTNINSKRAFAKVIESIIYLKQINPEYTWTRKEIGEFCGARTETVTRVLKKLESRYLINKKGREIEINDIQKLISLSQEEGI